MRAWLVFAAAAAVPLPAADLAPLPPALAGSEIFARLVEHNHQQESLLSGYSERRTYSAENSSGKVYAVEQVRMSYAPPGEKSFELISGQGSWLVRDLVFSRLREAESATARGKDHADSSITPANYRFETVGAEEIGGRPCYIVKATPLHKSKYLFEGRVWIDAADFAIAKIQGHPAANPSFWTHHVEFTRTYSKVGDFWLPAKDATIADMRLYGRKTLSITHYDYVLELGERVTESK
jgi:hypothetical protein